MIKGGQSWRVLEAKINDGTTNARQQEAFERQVRLVEKIQEQVNYMKSVNYRHTAVGAMQNDLGIQKSKASETGSRDRRRLCSQLGYWGGG